MAHQGQTHVSDVLVTVERTPFSAAVIAADQPPSRGPWSRLGEAVFGRRLPSSDESKERLSKVAGLAVLSSDVLSSTAYATEELLLVLVLGGAGALAWSVPVSLSIVGLLAVLTISYRQTIRAYPQGGGAYNVAKANLGTEASLVAAAGLLIDYVLTVSVSTTAGIAAITSAFPDLRPYRVYLAVAAILVLLLVNLRGVRTTGRMFTVPTLLFIGTMLMLIGVGLYKLLTDQPLPPSPELPAATAGVTVFLIFRAFSAGTTALTGMEAISNGVYVFKKPEATNARTVLLWMALILGVLFTGVTWLAHELQVTPSPDQTVVSQIARTMLGIGPLYYLVQIVTLTILLVAANTAYSGFPRVASVLAKDSFLPRQLSTPGWRLVYSNGIILLSLLAVVVVSVFGGDVHRLIPLYVVGVFISFTLSQSGMVRHWLRERGHGWRWSAAVNGVGATLTGFALVIIAATKFTHGAWAVILLLLLFLLMFRSIRRHYEMVARELSLEGYTPRAVPMQHTVLIPVAGVHRGVLEALAYARTMSASVRAVYVCTDPATESAVREKWEQYVPDVPLEVIHSPYRLVIRPFLRFLDEVRSDNRIVTVIIPDFVPMHWWEWLLHSQTSWFMQLALAFRRGVAVTSVHHQLRQ